MQKKQNCPICHKEVRPIQRHPYYLCISCKDRATDAKGRKLYFSNIDFAGGFQAWYLDTDEKYDSHICYVDGVKCYADEYRFGGIVIEKIVDRDNE